MSEYAYTSPGDAEGITLEHRQPDLLLARPPPGWLAEHLDLEVDVGRVVVQPAGVLEQMAQRDRRRVS